MNLTQAPEPPAPTPNCGTFDLHCYATEAAASVFEGLVGDVARGAAELVVTMSTWWVHTASVNPADSAVLAAQGATRYLVWMILTVSVLVQAIRLILTRKPEPLITVATGLIRFAVVSALGLVVLQAALSAGDALAIDLLKGAANNFAFLMRGLLIGDHTGLSSFVMLLIALFAAVAAVVQWMLMLIRQAGLLVLAAMLPLAASGSLNRSTRPWLHRLLSWLIALVVYKPAAAFIYYIGFSYMSSPASNDPGALTTMLTGCVVLCLAVIAMPILLRFFAWTGIQIGGASGGGSGFLGAAGALAMSRSYRGSQAVDRAVTTERSGPDSVARLNGQSAAPSGAATAGTGVGSAASVAAPAAAAMAAAAAADAAVRRMGSTLTGGQS